MGKAFALGVVILVYLFLAGLFSGEWQHDCETYYRSSNAIENCKMKVSGLSLIWPLATPYIVGHNRSR